MRPVAENAQKLLTALNEFGFGSLGLKVSDFDSQNKVIQLGVPPVRIDILTFIDGVTWDEIAKNKLSDLYGDVPVYYINKKDLIKNKQTTGRHKDLADIDALKGQ